MKIEWVDTTTGKVLRQPIDPHTTAPKKSYDPSSGVVDYPAFNLHRGGTGVWVCGAASGTVGSIVRHTITAADAPGGVGTLPRTFINTYAIRGVGVAYQFPNPGVAC